MKTKLILLLALSISAMVSAQSTFQKGFGGSQFEYGYAIQKTNDGGCIVGGYTASYGISMGQCYVVKFDVGGNKQWSRTYGGLCGRSQPINDLWQTSDSGYVMAGNSNCTTGVNTANAYVVRTNANGDTLWTRAWGENIISQFTNAYEVIQTRDGNILVGGYTTSYGAGEDAFLLKLDDATGDTIWTRVLGGPQGEWIRSIYETNDGGILMCGLTNSFGAGSNDVLLIKADSGGNVQWSKAYGTSGPEYGLGHCTQQTSDGGYIVLSSTGYLLKTDSLGNITWQKQYTGVGNYTSDAVEQTSDKGYIFGGYIGASSDTAKALLVRTDSVGNVLWSMKYGDSCVCYAVKQADDGGFFMTGQIQKGANGIDAYLVKTNANGSSGCNESDAGITAIAGNYITTPVTLSLHYGSQTRPVASYVDSGYSETSFCLPTLVKAQATDPGLVSVYPNPFSASTILQFNQQMENGVLDIINLYGQKIVTMNNITGKEVKINRDGLPAGMYFIRITGDSKSFITQKVVITD